MIVFGMAVILGLLIICLGIYFLSLFFQVARMEKEMTEGVTMLERYMIVTYALGEGKAKKDGEGEASADSASAPPKPA